ncbi:Zf-CCHC domain-containing protein [Quillaja saponaria]|uniref:Zf-CCHC domain-containing protein n=1 Tax=Quillaja saponaria TaxID=32244 RepID=A0AAD7LFV5_QUISA|nr:Zf-CCHC domain-containing protein [Quillaja saponaria]
MTEQSSIYEYVLKMIGHIEQLNEIGFNLDTELCTYLILQSLSDTYLQFVMNFHMNKLEASLPELVNMLKTAKPFIENDKNHIMYVVSSSKSKKGESFSKKKDSKKKKLHEPMVVLRNLPRPVIKDNASIVVRMDIGREIARSILQV